MNRFYLVFFSCVLSIASQTIWAQMPSFTPLETLQQILPADVGIRPKLSLKENLLTIFVELSAYARMTAARPDSNNLTPGWTARQDRQLLETLTINKETFLQEGAQPIFTYFNKRMERAFELRPQDLWEHYVVVSNLFTDNRFWLSHYRNLLERGPIDWNRVPNPDWIGSVLIPALHSENTATITYNETLYLNLISFIKHHVEKSQPSVIPTASNHTGSVAVEGEISTQIQARSLIQAIEGLDHLFAYPSPRWRQFSPSKALELQQKYFEFLTFLTTALHQGPLLSALAVTPAFSAMAIESVVLNSFILGTQNHRMNLHLDSPRVKAFLSKHDAMVAWLQKSKDDGETVKRHRQAVSTMIYLRTLISLKTHLSGFSEVISKGQWVSSSQFQKGLEILWHEELVKAHLETLRTFQLTLYSVSLLDKCYRERLATPTCETWRKALPLQAKEMITDKGKQITWELVSTQPLRLPPGILTLGEKEKLRLIAPEVHFTPLTRIVAPTGQVEIQSGKVSYPWIDVSGLDASPLPPDPGAEGQRPWIKNSVACSPKDYIEGVNFVTLPGREKPQWVGFSMENPLPSNVLVCASNALANNRDLVANLEQLVDLGQAPRAPVRTVTPPGAPGGQIKIELTSAAHRDALMFPLLLAMGGDGRSGQSGHSSPLCTKGLYQSFKIGLSHHKKWFQQWLAIAERYPQLELTLKEEYEDHWYGLFEVNLPRTGGTDGGDGGGGGQITLVVFGNQSEQRPRRWFLSAGLPGEGGKAGACGPNDVNHGRSGKTSHAGMLNLLRK